MNRNPFSKFHTKTKNKSYKKEKRRAQSEFEFRFLPGGEKMENENGSPISFFCCKEKRKTKIKFVFHFPIQLKIGWR